MKGLVLALVGLTLYFGTVSADAAEMTFKWKGTVPYKLLSLYQESFDFYDLIHFPSNSTSISYQVETNTHQQVISIIL